MSGFISSAGSKSGLIGETELDYEEGTWVPSTNNIDRSSGYYVKIGKIVYVNGYFNWDSVATARTSFSGLPFAPRLYETGWQGAGVCNYNTVDDSILCRVGSSASNFGFNKSSGAISFSDANGEMAFSIMYEVA